MQHRRKLDILLSSSFRAPMIISIAYIFRNDKLIYNEVEEEKKLIFFFVGRYSLNEN